LRRYVVRTDLLGGGEGALSRGLALELSLRHGRGGGWQIATTSAFRAEAGGKSLRRLLSRGSRCGGFGVFYWPGRKEGLDSDSDSDSDCEPCGRGPWPPRNSRVVLEPDL
jgi:hypothetical protein